ncbi:Grx4 family monothiol glutaredoxin [Buchnera aphidicola]|uniref:Glutaredoxin n=1 Tax=Buchnera aphidicola (Cinara laricifoliae) TaxID=2518977 RepID=A0A451DBB3_9GAMM|nr:Grx4 family monothiol glutaredoxin [Buchnera aphidicola]VFP83610.1 Glutaredoxin 4 [Buchnera aphidicola (Cinara laricifoliae)]
MKDVFKKIDQQLSDNNIILYMKGSPEHPSCGFSARAVQILSSYTSNFIYIDVLQHNDIRLSLPKYANWPTFPQLWINKKLIGGCDIILELSKSGELLRLIQSCKKNINKN